MAENVDDAARSADLELIRAIADGDEAAFGQLAEREAPRLLRFVRGLLGNAEEAEDVVQDALFSLWRNAAGWTPRARIGTWLHTVCYNRAIDVLRRRRRFVDEALLAEHADTAAPPDAGVEAGERARILHEALQRLPERQRTAVLLFHFQELPQSAAAEVMGISEAAFESLLARARRQLRSALAGGDLDA